MVDKSLSYKPERGLEQFRQFRSIERFRTLRSKCRTDWMDGIGRNILYRCYTKSITLERCS